MKILVVSLSNRARNDAFSALAKLYLDRLAAYAKVEATVVRDEPAFFAWVERQRSRTPPYLAMLESRGQQASSEQFAEWLGRQRDMGTQTLVFAIGSADGWTPEGRARADSLLSLGSMTLPHELARVVLAEQLYRAFTILAGHPYHSGH